MILNIALKVCPTFFLEEKVAVWCKNLIYSTILFAIFTVRRMQQRVQ